MPIEPKDYSVAHAVGYVEGQLQHHADNEYKRQLMRVVRFAKAAMWERKDGVLLADIYSHRYRRELETPATEKVQ